MASPQARARLESSGHELVAAPGDADWAIAYHQDELDGILGVVPEVVLHTYEPFYTPAWPLDASVDGTRVRSFSPWTVGLEESWRHWLTNGPREYVDPRQGRRSGTALLASVKPFRHGVVSEDLTQIRYDLGVRGYERGQVDVYGQGWDGVEIVEDSRHPKGESFSDAKHRILQGCAVNISLESAHVRGFVTEKLWQAIRAGCLPVYFGSSWLDELIPRGAYIDLRDFDGVDAVLDGIASLRRSKIADRVLELQRALRELESGVKGRDPVRTRWIDDVVGYIDYRNDTAVRAQGALGAGAASILDYRDKRLGRFVADIETHVAETAPTTSVADRPAARTVHLSDAIPYMNSEDRKGVWRERGFTVVDDPADASWAVAYHQRHLPELVGRVPRIVFHTYEPLFTRSLPYYSRMGTSEVFSLGVWTAGLEDTWRYWLRSGPQQYLDPAEGDRSRAVVLASTKAWAHDKFAEDLTGLRHRIAVGGQQRGLFDIYGRDWGDVVTMGESRHNTGGWAEAKHAILGGYAFNLCLENNHVPAFVTEKPWQAIRGGCLPIYYGSSWMDRLFPSKDYLDLRDYESIEALYEHMEKMPRDEIVARVRRLQDQLKELERTTEGGRASQGLRWLHDVASFIEGVDENDARRGTAWDVSHLAARDFAQLAQQGEPLPEPRPLRAVQPPRRRWWQSRR